MPLRVNNRQALKIVMYFWGQPYHQVNGRRTKMKAQDLSREQTQFAGQLVEAVIEATFRMGVVEDLYNATSGAHPDPIEVMLEVAEGYRGRRRTRDRNRRQPLSTSVYNSIKTQVRGSFRSQHDLLFVEVVDAHGTPRGLMRPR